ncbi:hypothetical protein SAMN05216343_103193 [Oscillibacter sp. PC13]|uniref:hypothetical protein n=1 Tax=Oscillibacter sp. PC13 TaxID=1855299 RepID=UPI0008E91125|nr:hypothetical protein [Oscillibacter sp. PC13]SFP15144.1 hypothetical protein SAMN05216343_103193 [Oscillibacter sp. PC13]
MIGSKMTLRVRMAAGENSTGGTADFWGDAGNQLAIRLFGDDRLFMGYDSTRNLAPVHDGDFVVYIGWIETMDRHKLTCKFQAYKYAAMTRETSLAILSNNAAPEKILCGEAVGALLRRSTQDGSGSVCWRHAGRHAAGKR